MADRTDHLSQADTEAPHPTPATGGEGRLIVVGIGASAGGLEVFERFLKQMPPDPRIAVVLVQHLDPQHESRLPELLDMGLLTELFRHKILRSLRSQGKVTRALVENLLSWPHFGFHIHQGERIEADEKTGGKRVAAYILWFAPSVRGR